MVNFREGDSQVQVPAYPKYKVHILDLGDADSIIIQYQRGPLFEERIVVIDAGNVDDSSKIKNYLKSKTGKTSIDIAVCSHPDKDHKGGFFGLFEDKEVTIREFWFLNPYKYMNDSDFAKMKKTESKKNACERIYNHPSDNTKNLIRIAEAKINSDGTKCNCCDTVGTCSHDIPLYTIGPLESYYRQVAIGLVKDFAELTVKPNLGKYVDNDEISEQTAKSVIDDVVDESFTNKASMILLFEPKEGKRFLLTGDASSDSIRSVIDRYDTLKNCILKVPHHGSRRNLNSEIIDALQPTSAVISAAGNEKHPNKYLVQYLSKYCNVYSTHKSGNLFYTSEKNTHPANPLKKKL